MMMEGFSMTEKNKTVTTPEDKKMLNSVFWRTMTLSASWNYETQQALGYTYAMLPVLRRFYPDKEKRVEAMKRHHVLFNTTPTMGGMITGLSASMEKKASEDPEFDTSSINTVKVALMGPFAGIGDSIFQGTLRVITLGIGISLAATGNIFGAILHVLLYNVLAHLVRYYGVTKSYEMGEQLMSNMSESGLMGKLTKAASIVGMMTVGAMAVTMTNFTIDKVWVIQGSEIVVQSILDSIFPHLLPLLLTFGCYKAVKKGVSPALLMLILIVVGTLGKFVGLF